jgi:hypothetical protein
VVSVTVKASGVAPGDTILSDGGEKLRVREIVMGDSGALDLTCLDRDGARRVLTLAPDAEIRAVSD